MANRITIVLAASLASLLLGVAMPVAAAPVGGAGPEEEACVGLAAGEVCSLPNNNPGTCQAATCNRLDYSGGSPPKAIEEACLVCKGGQQGPPMLGGDSGGSGEAPAGEGGAATDASAGAVPDDKEPPASSSRCRVDDRTPSPAGLALLLGMLMIVRSRRAST